MKLLCILSCIATRCLYTESTNFCYMISSQVDSRSILVQTEAAPLSVQHSDLITSGPQERHQQETSKQFVR